MILLSANVYGAPVVSPELAVQTQSTAGTKQGSRLCACARVSWVRHF